MWRKSASSKPFSLDQVAGEPRTGRFVNLRWQQGSAEFCGVQPEWRIARRVQFSTFSTNNLCRREWAFPWRSDRARPQAQVVATQGWLYPDCSTAKTRELLPVRDRVWRR